MSQRTSLSISSRGCWLYRWQLFRCSRRRAALWFLLHYFIVCPLQPVKCSSNCRMERFASVSIYYTTWAVNVTAKATHHHQRGVRGEQIGRPVSVSTALRKTINRLVFPPSPPSTGNCLAFWHMWFYLLHSNSVCQDYFLLLHPTRIPKMQARNSVYEGHLDSWLKFHKISQAHGR